MAASALPRATRIFLRPLAATAMAITLLLPSGCSKVEQARQTASASTETASVAVQAESFRLLGAVGLLKGLQAYGTPPANLRFKALGEKFVTTPDWQTGWQLFLSTALTTVARGDSAQPLVGYYHPASDTMLLTTWQKQGDGGWKIIAADILPGAMVRGARPPYSLARSWQQQDLYPPEALGQITAQTLRDFAAGFTQGGGDPLAGLPAPVREALPAMAAVPFEAFRTELVPLYGNEPDAHAIMALWSEVLGSAATGKTQRSGDFAQSIAALGKLDPKLRASLTPVAFLSAEQTQIVLFTSQLRPNLTVALQAERNGTDADPRRLDLMTYRAFVEAAAKGGVQ